MTNQETKSRWCELSESQIKLIGRALEQMDDAETGIDTVRWLIASAREMKIR